MSNWKRIMVKRVEYWVPKETYSLCCRDRDTFRGLARGLDVETITEVTRVRKTRHWINSHLTCRWKRLWQYRSGRTGSYLARRRDDLDILGVVIQEHTVRTRPFLQHHHGSDIVGPHMPGRSGTQNVVVFLIYLILRRKLGLNSCSFKKVHL